MKTVDRETRSYHAEFRAADEGKLTGHAATFNDVYDLGMFSERIAPGAFDDVLDDDVRALFNHDQNFVLGRTKSGTLRLNVDKRGLVSEIDLPESATALREAIARGDVDQMSFGFTVAKDSWETLDEDSGKELRTIEKIGRLFDVSPVTFPANPNTDVALRGLEEYRTAKQAKADESREIEGQTTENSEPVVKPDPQAVNKLRLAEVA